MPMARRNLLTVAKLGENTVRGQGTACDCELSVPPHQQDTSSMLEKPTRNSFATLLSTSGAAF